MANIRVALISLPTLMRDIVQFELSHQPDFEVVPIAPSIVTRAVPMSPALDAIIVGEDERGRRPDAFDVLEMWPHAKVLVVSAGGRAATLVSLHQHRTELGYLDAHGLVCAIRAALESGDDA